MAFWIHNVQAGEGLRNPLGSPGVHGTEDKMAMPSGTYCTDFHEEGSASMQSPQPEDRVWQTGQWVSPATDPARFSMSASEVLVGLVMQNPTECTCRLRRQCTIAEVAGPT